MEAPHEVDRLIPSASVVVVRETPARGIETLMLRRGEASFAANVWVFPGGAVDAADQDPALVELSVGLTPADAYARIGGRARRGPLTPAACFGVWVAAVRELFEEVGLALVYDRSGALLRYDSPAVADRWERHRQRLLGGAATLADVLRAEGARLALDRLTYYSHWITPRARSRRYNTHFFLAEPPPGQLDRHHPAEAEESRWIDVDTAVALNDRGEFPLILVTRAHLERLATYRTLAALFDHARTKQFPAVEALPPDLGAGVRERLSPEVAQCW